MALTRRSVETWLTRNGFSMHRAGKTSHRVYVRNGVVITIAGHGSPDLSKKHTGMIMRRLVEAGFDRAAVLRELETC